MRSVSRRARQIRGAGSSIVGTLEVFEPDSVKSLAKEEFEEEASESAHDKMPKFAYEEQIVALSRIVEEELTREVPRYQTQQLDRQAPLPVMEPHERFAEVPPPKIQESPTKVPENEIYDDKAMPKVVMEPVKLTVQLPKVALHVRLGDEDMLAEEEADNTYAIEEVYKCDWSKVGKNKTNDPLTVLRSMSGEQVCKVPLDEKVRSHSTQDRPFLYDPKDLKFIMEHDPDAKTTLISQ